MVSALLLGPFLWNFYPTSHPFSRPRDGFRLWRRSGFLEEKPRHKHFGGYTPRNLTNGYSKMMVVLGKMLSPASNMASILGYLC